MVTNAVGTGVGNISASILSRAASSRAVYTQISQHSPYYNADGNLPSQHAYSDDYDNNRLQPDQVPLNHEFETFSRGYQDVLTRIREEDSASELGHHNNDISTGNTSTAVNTDDGSQTIRAEDEVLLQRNRDSGILSGSIFAAAAAATGVNTAVPGSSAANANHTSSSYLPSAEPAATSSRGSNNSAFGDSTLSGTKRDSSGVLPRYEESQQHYYSSERHSMQNRDQSQSPLNLRGGGSSGIGSPNPSEMSAFSSITTTTTSTSANATATVGPLSQSSMRLVTPSMGSGQFMASQRTSAVSSHIDNHLSLNMTSPSLSLDGQMGVVGSDNGFADGLSPPTAAFAAGGDKTTSPPSSPPMRPLWQQNRQKSRNLMWL